MSTIFPLSASAGQVFDGYTFDGTAWNINGIDLTENYLEESSASAIYLTIASASTIYATTAAFRLYQSSAQSIATATNTVLLFDSEDLDTDNGHSTTTNTSRYTATVPGWYFVSGTVQLAYNATGNRLAIIQKNGTTTVNQVGRASSSVSNTMGLHLSTLVYLNGTTDYIELSTFQSSGVSLNTLTTNPSILEGYWVRS